MGRVEVERKRKQDALLKKKGYTEIESIKEDPDFPACLDKPVDRLK